MKFLFVLLMTITSVFAHEKELKTQADKLATASFSSQRFHPWPFPLLSIGHNMQSFQNYGGSAYWHDGLDIRSLPEQLIYASTGGKVVNIENYQTGNSLYWEIAILDDEGFVWKYHHVERKSIPQDVFIAFEKGLSIPAGTLLGKVIEWPHTSFGESFHHLHLLIVAKDGKYINPLLMMAPLEDTKAPDIKKIGLAKNHRPINGKEVSGEHSIYMEASDLILHERYILPPHKISYKLDGEDENVVWEFIHLPSGKNDTDYINDFYMPGTCGNYTCRRLYFNLNFTLNNPRKILNLRPGIHQIEVVVEDVAGNKASELFEWTVR